MASSSNSNGTRSEHFADPGLTRMQTSVQTMTQQARTCPIVQGTLLANVTLTAGGTTNNVPHGLGRAFIGYIVTYTVGVALVSAAATQKDTTKYVSLITTENSVVSLWVF